MMQKWNKIQLKFDREQDADCEAPSESQEFYFDTFWYFFQTKRGIFGIIIKMREFGWVLYISWEVLSIHYHYIVFHLVLGHEFEK